MTFIIAAAFSLICIAVILLSPRLGILFLFVLKPIVDATWDNHMGGINALKILGALVPLVFFIRFLFTSDLRKHGAPFALLWLFFFLSNLICFALIVVDGRLVGAIEFIMRVSNGLIGFYMLRTYIDDEKWFKRFVIALLVAGIFPVAMGVYQAATGEIWRLRTTVGLVRNVGIYHDAFSLRYLVFQTFTGILLYWSIFKKKGILSTLFLTGYSIASLVVLFKLYSKAGYAILIIWAITWSFFNKKILHFILLSVLVVGLNIAFNNDIIEKFSTVFSKEVSAFEGTGDERKVLGGRIFLWEDYWDAWKNSGTMGIMFGTGASAGSAHNDFLRVLVSSGLFGLINYVALLIGVGWQVFLNLLRERNAMTVMVFMVFTGWLADSIGLVPGLYSGYQWYAWGIIGLGIAPLPYLQKLVSGEKMEYPVQTAENASAIYNSR